VSPEPYVRGQAYVLGALLVISAIFGWAQAALACSAATGLVAAVLHFKYRRECRGAEVSVPPHRERLDLIVAGDVRTAVLLGLTAGMLLLLFPHDLHLGIAPETSVLLSVACAAVLLSSLVDWYVILPRVSGLLGIRPCRHPDADFPRAPKTWREITRWWYIHRIAAALILRFGISFAVVLTVDRYTSVPGGASLVGGAVAGGFASYLVAIPKAFWQVGHPDLIVGRTIRRHRVTRVPRHLSMFGARIPLPLLTRREIGPLRPREYVYDVALEGVQLVAAAKREGKVPRDEDGDILYERDPIKLKVKDVEASEPEPAEEPFCGCRDGCSGINWYCIENPRCFATK
jgi:hypothetical protein